MVDTKEVEARKRPARKRRRRFLGFLPILGVRSAVFRDLGAYGKERCKMSENKVVHHNQHYGNLLVW
jgi:hypothetical protein